VPYPATIPTNDALFGYRGGYPPKKNFQPNFDEKKTDLDIFGILKMSKNEIYKKSFGNSNFPKAPYEGQVKL
jgi:hypothetical protein